MSSSSKTKVRAACPVRDPICSSSTIQKADLFARTSPAPSNREHPSSIKETPFAATAKFESLAYGLMSSQPRDDVGRLNAEAI